MGRQWLGVSQKRFTGIEPRADIVASGVVQEVEQHLFFAVARPPDV